MENQFREISIQDLEEMKSKLNNTFLDIFRKSLPRDTRFKTFEDLEQPPKESTGLGVCLECKSVYWTLPTERDSEAHYRTREEPRDGPYCYNCAEKLAYKELKSRR